MIGILRGIMAAIYDNIIVVDVTGIGYEVETIGAYQFGNIGDNIVVHTHLLIREEQHVLIGFNSVNQRNLFRQLIKISAVGPKIAMAILAHLSLEQLRQIALSQNSESLCIVPGIGRKLAAKIMLDLSYRMAQIQQPNSDNILQPVNAESLRPLAADSNEIVLALIALGYTKQQAVNVVNTIGGKFDNVANGIRQALKLLQ
jgi:holliday junction DNA helicase RuvA